MTAKKKTGYATENKKRQPNGEFMRKEDALKYAAAHVAGYGVPVDMVYAPPKTTILIIETNGKQETIAVDTGNMSPGELTYLQQKLADGAQLSVVGSAPIPLIQSRIVTNDHTVSWISDIQSNDTSLSDVMARYKSLLTRIYTMCMIATSTDDTNMKATLKSIITMIDEDV